MQAGNYLGCVLFSTVPIFIVADMKAKSVTGGMKEPYAPTAQPRSYLLIGKVAFFSKKEYIRFCNAYASSAIRGVISSP